MASARAATARPATADTALQRLLAGNARFVTGTPRPRATLRARLADLIAGQQPYATILGCSDSRVAPELIFDAGLGDLFIVRVAGNVISAEVMGSLQYAAVHLATQLFVVLGHEGCGAVQAALVAMRQGPTERRGIQSLLESITPGLAGIDAGGPPATQLARAVEANVRWSVRQLTEMPYARKGQAAGLKIVGAVYALRTGRVSVLA